LSALVNWAIVKSDGKTLNDHCSIKVIVQSDDKIPRDLTAKWPTVHSDDKIPLDFWSNEGQYKWWQNPILSLAKCVKVIEWWQNTTWPKIGRTTYNPQ
jgi:hypothetical protein